jgi:multidrug efflux system outer membrane protein
MSTRNSWSTFIIMMSALLSCKSVDPVDLSSPIPTSYLNSSDSLNDSFEPWRVFYKDPLLVNLLDAAVRKSFDIRTSQERSGIALSSYNIAKSRFLPEINLGVFPRVDRFGKYTMNGVGNDDTNRSETLPADQKLPNPYTEYAAGLTFSWEANLWQRLSSRRSAAQARLLSSREVIHGVTSFVVSQVATQYYELLGLDREKNVLLENLELQRLALELMTVQKEAGKATQLAVDQFESQFLNTRNKLFRVEQEILETESSLMQMSGLFPALVARDSIRSIDSVFVAHVGTPSDLLAQRPDIREAEFNVMAAHGDLISARAAFYPSLSLSGSAGLASFDISKLLSPASLAYGIGASLAAPVIQRKRIKALYEASDRRQRVALLEYQSAILTAFHEVYRTNNNGITIQKQITVKRKEVEVLKRATANSNELFNVGFATYLEVITAQRRLLEVELELADLYMNLLQNRAMLYRALGGGWRFTDRPE